MLIDNLIAETAARPTTIRPTGKLQTPGREHAPETFEVHGQRQLAIPLIRRVATIVFEGLCSRETRSTVPESEVSSTAIRVGPCLNPKMPVLQSERSRT